MKFDMTFFNEIAMPMVVAACLIIGYIVKKWVDDVDNKYIPSILAILGAVLGCIVKQCVSVEVLVGGAFSGLISTGLHQVFKQLIGGDNSGNPD